MSRLNFMLTGIGLAAALGLSGACASPSHGTPKMGIDLAGFVSGDAALPMDLSHTGPAADGALPTDMAIAADLGGPFFLTINEHGTGTGTITSDTGGVYCGAACTASYLGGTTVTLTATAALGSVACDWGIAGCTTSAPCTVTMTTDVTIDYWFTVDLAQCP